MKKESNDNGVFSGQADTGEAGPSTAGEDIATVHSDSKRRPLRAPSKLLQRDMSQELSSSQSSDIDTVSIDSDLSETRDRFDSGTLDSIEGMQLVQTRNANVTLWPKRQQIS